MNTEAGRIPSASPDRWPLARIMIFILANAFVGLAADIRVEHADAVHERIVAWIPIVYSAFMTIACLAAFVFWNKTARRVMPVLFAAAFVVGGLGFWFHNHGNIKGVITDSINAWVDPRMHLPDGPPEVAPLAFAGLGVLGILASLKRFNP
jgi:hypothetical protein